MNGMTEWYPMKRINPVRVGWYDYKCGTCRSSIYWDGRDYKYEGNVRWACPNCRWRGFTKKTNAALGSER